MRQVPTPETAVSGAVAMGVDTMGAEALEKLLQRPDIWQAAHKARDSEGAATGYGPLDQQLHQGGWPRGSLVEVLGGQQGIGELQLLLPTLVRLTSAGQHCLLLAPPYIPYPPALEAAGACIDKLLVVESRNPQEQLWCAEQALRSGATACVLAWFGSQQLQTAQLRKLLLASKHSEALLFLYRSEAMARQASPASLRLRLASAAAGQLAVNILKQPGGWAGQSLVLERREAWLQTSHWHLPMALQGRRQAAPGPARAPQPPTRPSPLILPQQEQRDALLPQQ